MVDLVRHGLSGMPDSAARRAVIGAKLGIGYGNGKQFFIPFKSLWYKSRCF